MHKAKILIVDDERDARFILEKELTARGYSVVVAGGGREGWNLIRSEHPDLVVLDLWMPDMDGSELAARVKEHAATRDIPIVFLTALYQKKEEEEGRLVAGHVFIAKPYDIEVLSSLIQELLAERSAHAGQPQDHRVAAESGTDGP